MYLKEMSHGMKINHRMILDKLNLYLYLQKNIFEDSWNEVRNVRLQDNYDDRN